MEKIGVIGAGITGLFSALNLALYLISIILEIIYTREAWSYIINAGEKLCNVFFFIGYCYFAAEFHLITKPYGFIKNKGTLKLV